MRINTVELRKNSTLIEDYQVQKPAIKAFFDYNPFDNYQARVNDLKNRKFNRKQLVQVLEKLNKGWDASEKTLQHIAELEDERSVVVIGGQQAGLLTGPMYTVNKIISIIKLAREQRELLQIPVIPVFWIAGEDHDYDEINHTYINRDGKLHKHKINQQLFLKKSLSDVEMNKQDALDWVKEAFADLSETVHTKEVYHSILTCLEKSETYVDFCARLVFELFPDEGVVLIDSGNSDVRQLESEFFTELIEKQPRITQAVYETIEQLQHQGYTIPLDVTETDAHLFYHDANNERILLQRDGENWVGKNNEVSLSTSELLHIAKTNPNQLSNNVVTRPIVQELLFPTLAFIAGDGEISYWASLKKAFSIMNIQVPPVLPRLSMTYIPGRTAKLMEKRVVDVDDVINEDINVLKLNWLMTNNNPPVDILFDQAREGVEKIYAPLQKLSGEIGAQLPNIADKNLEKMKKNLTFLENKMMQQIKQDQEQVLTQFEEIEQIIKPNKVLQERIWSPLIFVNQYGIGFIKEMIKSDCTFTGEHYLVYL